MTFSDWDYINGEQNLDGGTYVSAPSSLWQKNSALYQSLFAICKVGATTTLVNARIVGWALVGHVGSVDSPSPRYYFRFQNTSNFYVITILTYEKLWRFTRVYNGAGTDIAQQPLTFTPAANAWYKFRATLWESGGYVYARLEWWNGTEWVMQGADLSDTSPIFPGGGKVGVGQYTGNCIREAWHDDTEIWG